MIGAWLWKIFIAMGVWIDQLTATLINWFYSVLHAIANVQVLSGDTILAVSQRIYIALGIFMLFRLAFTMINYVVSPDKMSDKAQGGGKLITRIAIALVLLVATPSLFSYAYKLQSMLLEEEVVQKIIFGKIDGKFSENEGLSNGGKSTAYLVMTSFVTPNPNFPNMPESCLHIYNLQGKYGETDAVNKKTECLNFAAASGMNDRGLANLDEAISNQNIYKLLDADILNLEQENIFFFNYMGVISTISGLFVAWIFLASVMQVAVRAVKLAFLQMIAPIPIIASIDPKSGNETLKNWISETIKTYLQLFIRLATVFLAVMMISMFFQGSGANFLTHDGEGVNGIIKVIIVIGILIFANEIPKVLETIFPKMKGSSFSLNPMKEINSSSFAKGALGGVIGGGAASLSNIVASRNEGNGWLRTLRSAGGGLGSGAARGFKGGMTSGDKGSLLDVTNKARLGSIAARDKNVAIRKYNASIDKENNPDAYYGVMKRNVTEPFLKWAGVKNKSSGQGMLDEQVREAKEYKQNYVEQETAYRHAQTELMSNNFNKWDRSKFLEVASSVKKTSKVDTEGDSYNEYSFSSYEEYAKDKVNELNSVNMESGKSQILVDLLKGNGLDDNTINGLTDSEVESWRNAYSSEIESKKLDLKNEIEKKYASQYLSRDVYETYTNQEKAIKDLHENADLLERKIKRKEKLIMQKNDANKK